ncbi:aspartate carbamoyltransferase catalytic subunit [Pontibacillus yanchengensis]|uniref:Aspartate carbamoyltransferase n=1 Tax=Pontibacillus yanchengensis Y32 TaxID=1385514 RepID=A0A0A2TBG3_9BACI|nr:aspartate carbamoyltransferase catalytic subunit [Pontibacillus yanchengensis]KGP71391.1 aspartate carbamoyltransferase catalytic subunit [Pontibacillus yanchengensis Y32]
MHLLKMSDLNPSDIEKLIQTAKRFKSNPYDEQHRGFIANLFFEPSTRTKLSFEMAEKRLGYQTIDFSTESSSVQKGESLYDTVKTVEALGVSAIVIRHPKERYYEELEEAVQVPIINGGDGKGEHPSQCLLDLYTIHEEFGDFHGLNIVISGDILHSRVARSNALTLQRLGANVTMSGPSFWQDAELGIPYAPIDEVISKCDVLMLLRIQEERHDLKEDHEDYLTNYGLTQEREQQMKKESIIMHPAPVNRGVEIASTLVECERSRIFAQMNNGVFTRMAILHELVQGGISNESITKKCSII